MKSKNTIVGVLNALAMPGPLGLGILILPEWDLLDYYSDGKIRECHPNDTELTFLMLVAEAENLWDKSK